MIPDRRHIQTEQPHPQSSGLDTLGITDALQLMDAENAHAVEAVRAARASLAKAVQWAADALSQGGRIIYAGAGTSGRLAVLDAAECPPTFSSDPSQVVAIIAGGDAALRQSIEGAEDDAEAGARAISKLHPGKLDLVIGIAAGGTTPFVHGVLASARAAGARTAFIVCTDPAPFNSAADLLIHLPTGPELITGSTRLKAGTATKLALNAISTLAMVQMGKVLGNMMVDVDAGKNAKLWDRAARIIETITGISRSDSLHLLQRANGRVKRALVMHYRGVSASEADHLLADGGLRLRDLIDRPAPTRND